jgi:hypothetical protein
MRQSEVVAALDVDVPCADASREAIGGGGPPDEVPKFVRHLTPGVDRGAEFCHDEIPVGQ